MNIGNFDQKLYIHMSRDKIPSKYLRTGNPQSQTHSC